jgi:hypothetical protein
VQSSNRRTSERISSVVRNVVASSVRIDISPTPRSHVRIEGPERFVRAATRFRRNDFAALPLSYGSVMGSCHRDSNPDLRLDRHVVPPAFAARTKEAWRQEW